MITKACCIIGRQSVPIQKLDFVKEKLKQEIEQAILQGFNTFITGMADGADLLFAQIVIEQKKLNPQLFLEAAIPYRKCLSTTDLLFHKCLKHCNGIHIQQNEFTDDCYFKLDKYMINACDKIITVYDDKKDYNTLLTIINAISFEKEICEIAI